jgi:hypothetical protein
LLAEAFPGKNRHGVLWDDQTAEQFASAEQEAQKMQLAMTSIKLMSSPYDFEKAFRTAEDNGDRSVHAQWPSVLAVSRLPLRRRRRRPTCLQDDVLGLLAG